MTASSVFGAGFEGLSERDRLRRAATELEAVVLAQLLGSMRRTVPKGGLFEESATNEMFRSMLDAELAREMAEKSPFGLAGAVVDRLENRVKPSPDGAERAERSPGSDDASRFRRVG